MSKMTTDQMIEVLQADKEGKTIERKYLVAVGIYSDWTKLEGMPTAFDVEEYRVKYEPKEFYIVLREKIQDHCPDTDVLWAGVSKRKAEHFASISGRKVYHVREVVED